MIFILLIVVLVLFAGAKDRAKQDTQRQELQEDLREFSRISDETAKLIRIYAPSRAVADTFPEEWVRER